MEKPLNKSMFPESLTDDKQRPLAFKNKPYIFISARVHPGETSASFAFEAIVDFLLLASRNNEEDNKNTENAI